MNDEDLDWSVYHHLIEDPGQDEETLAGKTGCSSGEIGDSIWRLEKAMLIAREGQGYRVLSVPEMLLQCQVRYDPRSQITFEGGVIRMRKGQD